MNNNFDERYLEVGAFVVAIITFIQRQNPNMQIISLLCFNLFIILGLAHTNTIKSNLIPFPQTYESVLSTDEKVTFVIDEHYSQIYKKTEFTYNIVQHNETYKLRRSNKSNPEHFDKFRSFYETNEAITGIETIKSKRFWIESSFASSSTIIPIMIAGFTAMLLISNSKGNLYNFINIQHTVALLFFVINTLNKLDNDRIYNITYGIILPLCLYGSVLMKDRYNVSSRVSKFLIQLLVILVPSVYFGVSYDNVINRDNTKGIDAMVGFIHVIASIYLSHNYGTLGYHTFLNLIPILLTYFTMFSTIYKLTNNAVNALMIITIVTAVAAYVSKPWSVVIKK